MAEPQAPPRRTWRSIFGRSSADEVETDTEKAGLPRPPKWSMGVLNDKETIEVPGSVLLLARDHNEPLGLRNAPARTSHSSLPTGMPHLAPPPAPKESVEDSKKKTPDGKIILEPQPEESGNDPLNWPSWRRDAALLSLGLFSMVGGGMTPILAAGFTNVAADYGVAVSRVSLTTGLYMLGMGLGSVVFSPTAILWGKRPVYLFGAVLFIVTSIWCAVSPSFPSLILARIFQGVAVSPVECLPSATIAEIFFLHERAFRIGIYTLLLLGGKNLVPLVSAAIMQRLGWRWVFWIVAIVVGFCFILLFLFVPETFWDRSPLPRKRKSSRPNFFRRISSKHTFFPAHAPPKEAHNDPLPAMEPSKDEDHLPTSPLRKHDHVGFASNVESHEAGVEQTYDAIGDIKSDNAPDAIAVPEQNGVTPGPVIPSRPRNTRHASFAPVLEIGPSPRSSRRNSTTAESHGHYPNGENHVAGHSTPNAVHPPPPSSSSNHVASTLARAGPTPYGGADLDDDKRSLSSLGSGRLQGTYTTDLRDQPPRSFVQQLKPYHGRLNKDKWWKVAIRPLILFGYPAVLWSAVVYACSVGWLIVISESVAVIYRDSHSYNFTALQTGLVYLSPFIGGVLGTAVAGKVSDIVVKAMARRNGGLYEPEFRLVMVIPVAISTVIGLMGFGWSAQEHDNFMVPTVFFGIVSFGCSLGSTTSITFCVDSYRQYAGEALVTLNFSKNVFHGLVFSLFVTEWVETEGSKMVYIWIGVIQLILLVFTIPMFLYGKRARMWTVRKNFMEKF